MNIPVPIFSVADIYLLQNANSGRPILFLVLKNKTISQKQCIDGIYIILFIKYIYKYILFLYKNI